jgi:hypothetical protein
MKFDDLTEEPCVPGNEQDGNDVDPTTCSTDPIAPAELILKPAYAITAEGGTVLYKTFLRANGDEIEITNGLNYTTNDVGVAIINATSGLATGVTAGITGVSVTWQDMSAHAQIEVVSVCSDVTNNFLILIDNSMSSKVEFSDTYASRLAYAKEAARRFANSVNYGKDKVGVAYFNEAGVVTLAPSSIKADVLAAIQAITSTVSKTNIYAGLQSGMNALNLLAGGKIVILFSDGEDNLGPDPLLLSEPWKEAGRLIIVIGLRTYGEFFDKLYRIASPGYFMSAYDDTEVSVIDTLVGIKSYFCSGDCQPEAGTYPVAQLNYRGFLNWDVISGEVDLIGLGVWDVLPGNGLYLDMSGTRNIPLGVVDVLPGGIRTKDAFSIVSGHEYSFSIDVAGNNVGINNTDPVHVLIQSEDGLTTYLDETITPSANNEPFTTHVFTFTAGATKTAKIIVEMVETGSSVLNVGPLVDNILFEDTTASNVLLDDDFDNENITTINPGYVYYGTCLDAPPGAQSADPEPPTPPTES